MPHSYDVSLIAECLRDDKTLEAANIPPIAKVATTAETPTAVQFSANRSALTACSIKLASIVMV